MEAYAVPQREVRVQVQLLDGRDLGGIMYVPLAGPDGTPGHLLDRLNEESTKFVALNDGKATHLVRTAYILTVQVPDDEVEERVEEQIEEAPLSHRLLIKFNLTFGVEVIGNLFFLQPADHARLQDYLNVAHRFISVVVQNKLTYVNREQVISARALRGE